MSAMEEQLQALRDKQAASARYTIYLAGGYPNYRNKTVIASGLHWKEAKPRMEQLNACREDKRFGAPIYGIQLEKP